jgi:hypothetical protein
VIAQNALIACFLTDKQLQKRRRDNLDRAAAELLGSEELNDGFRFRFPFSERMVRDLQEIVELERVCCPFLSFRLDSGTDVVSLELTGADGTKELVRELFRWD